MGDDVRLTNMCHSSADSWNVDHDPALKKVARFSLTSNSSSLLRHIPGTYNISSRVQIWLASDGEVMGKEIDGVLVGGLSVILGLVLALVGSALCCVAACCVRSSASGAQTESVGEQA